MWRLSDRTSWGRRARTCAPDDGHAANCGGRHWARPRGHRLTRGCRDNLRLRPANLRVHHRPTCRRRAHHHRRAPAGGCYVKGSPAFGGGPHREQSRLSVSPARSWTAGSIPGVSGAGRPAANASDPRRFRLALKNRRGQPSTPRRAQQSPRTAADEQRSRRFVESGWDSAQGLRSKTRRPPDAAKTPRLDACPKAQARQVANQRNMPDRRPTRTVSWISPRASQVVIGGQPVRQARPRRARREADQPFTKARDRSPRSVSRQRSYAGSGSCYTAKLRCARAFRSRRLRDPTPYALGYVLSGRRARRHRLERRQVAFFQATTVSKDRWRSGRRLRDRGTGDAVWVYDQQASTGP